MESNKSAPPCVLLEVTIGFAWDYNRIKHPKFGAGEAHLNRLEFSTDTKKRIHKISGQFTSIYLFLAMPSKFGSS